MAGTNNPTEASSQAVRKPGLFKRLYDRCMLWIQTPAGLWVFFLIAVAESSFFPIPPDVFLIALCVAAPRKSFRFAAICAVGSVLGGALGYAIGLGFIDTIGIKILDWYGLQEQYLETQGLYQRYDAWAVGAAGFTPLPYKLFTIAAGAFHIDFATFMLMSVLSRSARFFLVAGLVYKFGATAQYFINRYFNILSIAFFVLLIGGFVLIKYLL